MSLERSTTILQKTCCFRFERTIEAAVIFGILSKKCEGEGICSLTLEPDLENSLPRRACPVQIGICPDQSLIFLFRKKALPEHIRAKLDQDQFRVGETFTFSGPILDALQLPSCEIKAGSYLIEQTADEYIVKF